jgi:hypothetical protein
VVSGSEQTGSQYRTVLPFYFTTDWRTHGTPRYPRVALWFAFRNFLRGVAYRMLGSASEAEDAVQEAWLKLSRSHTAEVENLGGWLTTIVARTGGAERLPWLPRSAAHRGLQMPSKVARAALPALIDGEAGAVWAVGAWVRAAFLFTIERGIITGIDLIMNPEHLAELAVKID